MAPPMRQLPGARGEDLPAEGVAWRPTEAELRREARQGAASLIAQEIVNVQPMTGPIGGVAFYRPRYGAGGSQMEKPAGSDVWFKVSDVEALHALLEGTSGTLHGAMAPGDGSVAAFFGDSFQITQGLGRVQTGRYSVEGLRINEPYRDFLLDLIWGCPLSGWTSPLQVLALSAADGIKEVITGQE